MTESELNCFLMGAIAMGFALAALFFVRYWRVSRDRFFAWFALAFAVLALNRVALVVLDDARESRLAPYVVRLIAFLIIVGAFMDKNFRRVQPPQ